MRQLLLVLLLAPAGAPRFVHGQRLGFELK